MAESALSNSYRHIVLNSHPRSGASKAPAIVGGAEDARTRGPVVGTVTLVTFLLNWSQWFPVLVISRTPDTYTLPAALLKMNSELGTNFQGIMALATLTTVPVVVVFVLTQRRVMQGIAAGAIKG